MAGQTQTAVAREAAWLTTSGDGLPALQAVNGGPFETVQAYWPGARVGTQQTAVYVTRRSIADAHPTSQRYRPRYMFVLKIVWPVKQATGSIAEGEQQNLDNAIELLLERIRGPLGDKTHGGRFLSVAEVPEEGSVSVDFDDPETTIKGSRELRATVAYYADDTEFNG